MCQDFRRGLCNRGVNCRFMHGEDDDRPLVDGSYAFRPVRPDEFERQILGKNIDRAALCGCSPYSFLEGTRSETIGPLKPAPRSAIDDLSKAYRGNHRVHRICPRNNPCYLKQNHKESKSQFQY